MATPSSPTPKSTTSQNPSPQAVQSPSQQLQQQLMNKPTMSGKTIAIGCGVFAIIFAVVVMIALIIGLQNPSSIESFGITTDAIKALVKGIIVFIAVLFLFAGLGLAVWSGYRLFTKKEGSKLGYIAGLMGGIFFIMIAIGGGTAGILAVNAMDGSGVNASNIINPYLIVKQTNDRRVKKGRIYLGEPGLKVIAPANIAFQFNQDTFNRLVGSSLGGQLQSVILDCGNGQTIDSSRVNFDSELFFGQTCLYLAKGTYNQSLTYRYIDSITQQLKETTLTNLIKLDVHTQIDLSTKNGAYTLNDAKNEILIGENPTQLFVNATNIATDLGLVNSVIYWDMDGDGQTDKERVNFGYYYYTPKLHTVYYTLPEYPGIVYEFGVRVLQSNVPGCTVTTEEIKANQYRLGVKLADGGVNIDRYQFEIVDRLTDEIVDQIES